MRERARRERRAGLLALSVRVAHLPLVPEREVHDLRGFLML